jgi:hypothetical protein
MGGLEEQIKAFLEGHGGREGCRPSVSCDDVAMELRELEEKKGSLRVAMQEATGSVEASKLHSAARAKRQRGP